MAQATNEVINQLRSTLGKMEVALGSISDAIAWANPDGSVQWCNHAFARLVDQPNIMLIGANLAETVPLEEKEQPLSVGRHPVNVVQAGKPEASGIYEFRHDDNRLILEVTARLAIIDEEDASVVLVLHDMTERHQAQERLAWDYHVQTVLDAILHISTQPPGLKEILEKSLDALLSMPAFSLLNKGAIFVTSEDRDELELTVQRGLTDTLQAACARLPFGKCLCGRAAASHATIFADHVDEGHGSTCDGIEPQGHYCTPILANGEMLGVINTYVAAGHVRKNREEHFLTMVADTLASVIHRKRTEGQLEQLAHSDSLTGLPNRPLFFDRLHQTLAQARRQKNIFAVFFLDLDQFKDINDSLGHEAGDAVLKESAQRMLRCVREMDSVARMGGDEFTFIVMAGLQQPGDAAIVAKRVLHEMEAPFVLNGEKRHISASIGIAIYPGDGDDSETLVRHADTAMYQAKKKGGTYSFYSQKDN